MAGISEKTARVLVRCGAAEQAGGPDPAGQDGESRNGQRVASADSTPSGERVGTDSAVPAQPWAWGGSGGGRIVLGVGGRGDDRRRWRRQGAISAIRHP